MNRGVCLSSVYQKTDKREENLGCLSLPEFCRKVYRMVKMSRKRTAAKRTHFFVSVFFPILHSLHLVFTFSISLDQTYFPTAVTNKIKNEQMFLILLSVSYIINVTKKERCDEMATIITSIGLKGMESYRVQVEVQLMPGV